MARQPRRQGLADEAPPDAPALRPVASPVPVRLDAPRPLPVPREIVAPGAGESGMREVARGLADFIPSFRRWADDRFREESEAQREQGRSFAQSMKDYETEVREGRMAPVDNPWWQLGYRQGRGIVDAQRLGERLRVEYQQWEGRQGEDPAAVQSWINERSQGFLGQANDAEYLRGFQQTFQAVRQQIGEEHGRQVRANLAENGRNTVIERLRNEAAGILSDGRTPMSQALPRISEIFHRGGYELRRYGFSGEEVNDTLMQALGSLVDVTRRANPMDAIRLIEGVAFAPRPDDRNPGQTVPGFGNTPRGLERLRVLRDRAEGEIDRREARAERAAARAEREARREADRLMDRILFQGQQPSDAELQRAVQADPSFRLRLNNAAETLRRQEEQSTDRARAEQSERLFTGFVGRLLNARSSEDLATLRQEVLGNLDRLRGADAGRILDDIRRTEQDPNLRPGNPLGSTEFQSGVRLLEGLALPRLTSPEAALLGGGRDAQATARLTEMRQQLSEQTIRWYYEQFRQGNRPTGEQVFDFASRRARALVDALPQQPTGVQNRLAPQGGQQQQTPQQQQPQQPSPANRDQVRADVRSYLSTGQVPPRLRAELERRGVNPSDQNAVLGAIEQIVGETRLNPQQQGR